MPCLVGARARLGLLVGHGYIRRLVQYQSLQSVDTCPQHPALKVLGTSLDILSSAWLIESSLRHHLHTLVAHMRLPTTPCVGNQLSI